MGLTYTVYALRKKSNITTEETTEQYTNTYLFFYDRLILRRWLTEVRESFTRGGA